jgi:hypothetical protein
MSFERPSPDAALRLAKALSHPLRQRLLVAYMGKAASPSDVAAKLEEPLGNVSYAGARGGAVRPSRLALLHFEHRK